MSGLSPNGYSTRQRLNQSQGLDNSGRMGSPEKDNLISQLKSQIFDLEQNEKNYSNLQVKYKSLANENSILNEEKLRLEYELKQKTEASNKIIADLQNENENLQNALNEKQATNKTLFNDNNNLFASLEQKTDEVASLREALAERDALLDKLNEEKRNLERSLSLMGEAKAKSEASNQRLDNDLTSLRKVCDTQERNIEIFKSEKKNLLDKLDQANYDIDTLKAKVRSVTKTSNNNGKMLDEANKTIMKLDSDLTETEQNLNRAKNEINSLNSALMKEKRMHEEFEQKSERLEGTVKERLNDIKRLNNDNEELHNLIDKLTIEKNICLSDIDKYKAHIMFLTESNQKLTNELEGVVDRDEKIRAQLQRGERIGSLLAQNRNDIENALNNLEDSLQQNRGKSPYISKK